MKLTPAARALLDALQAAVPDQATVIEVMLLADDRFIGEGEGP